MKTKLNPKAIADESVSIDKLHIDTQDLINSSATQDDITAAIAAIKAPKTEPLSNFYVAAAKDGDGIWKHSSNINFQKITPSAALTQISPNRFYTCDTSTLGYTFTLYNDLETNVTPEWFIEFTYSGGSVTFSTTNIGTTIKWANGEAPEFENGKIYQIHLTYSGNNLLGVWAAF